MVEICPLSRCDRDLIKGTHLSLIEVSTLCADLLYSQTTRKVRLDKSYMNKVGVEQISKRNMTFTFFHVELLSCDHVHFFEATNIPPLGLFTWYPQRHNNRTIIPLRGHVM